MLICIMMQVVALDWICFSPNLEILKTSAGTNNADLLFLEVPKHAATDSGN